MTNSDGINVPWGSKKDDVTPQDASLSAIGSQGDTYTLTREQAAAADQAANAKKLEEMENYQAPQIADDSLNAALNRKP